MRSALKRFDPNNLRLRVLSAAVMIPAVALCVYLGGTLYSFALICVMTMGLYEWLQLVAPGLRKGIMIMACTMLVVQMVAAILISPTFGAILGVISTLTLFFIASHDRDQSAGWVAVGIPYMGGWGLAMLLLRSSPSHGMAMIFYLFATVWGTDIGAFVAGRLIGGPKLLPHISPAKTWAGLVGGIALGLLLGYAVALIFAARHPAIALILSPFLSCTAQLGDLFESSFKRRSGVKQSGDLIPGHGGVLDRIDGLVFAGIFAFLFQVSIGMPIEWW